MSLELWLRNPALEQYISAFENPLGWKEKKVTFPNLAWLRKSLPMLFSRPAYFRQGQCYTAKYKRNTGTGNYYYMGN